MKIVIAPDSFKGSLTSLRAARIIKNGEEFLLATSAEVGFLLRGRPSREL